MKKFDLNKIERELKHINKANGIETTAGIQLIINNITIYNDLITLYEQGNVSKVYNINLLSNSIFKQLTKYNIFPDSTNEKITKSSEYIFDKIKKNVEKR